jgi:bacterial leucyl aminopeptidase
MAVDLTLAIEVVFFDIGDTLASASFHANGRLILKPLPNVASRLAELKARGLRLGIISNTGDLNAAPMRDALTAAGLYDVFGGEPALLIYSAVAGMEKISPAIFKYACQQAGLAHNPVRCMFVGENAQERAFASQAGFGVTADPATIF